MLRSEEHTAGVVVDDFSTVDDFLSAHHHATCQRNAAQQIVFLGIALLFIVHDIGLYIVVEVAP